ncbi:MAG: hypothetical protein U0900_09395 [Myxococcota bacterium]
MSKQISAALAVAILVLAQANAVEARVCSNGRSADGAMWMSIGWPGFGEWHLKGYGSFGKMPQKKFWMAFIPIYGWIYLRIVSGIDASHCRVDDDLNLD